MECKNNVAVKCDMCGHTNSIPLSRLYDGFEGIFQCEKCMNALESLHDILDE